MAIFNSKLLVHQPRIHRDRLRALPLREFEVGSQILHQGFHLWPAGADWEASPSTDVFFRRWDKNVTDIRKIEAKLWISMDIYGLNMIKWLYKTLWNNVQISDLNRRNEIRRFWGRSLRLPPSIFFTLSSMTVPMPVLQSWNTLDEELVFGNPGVFSTYLLQIYICFTIFYSYSMFFLS